MIKRDTQLLNSSTLSRREFLAMLSALSLVGVAGCRRPFERPVGVHDLGEVKELLNASQFVQERAFVVTRDDQGWTALSTRCTYDGCELSYQDRALICMCCGSAFAHTGQVLRGPAGTALPYYSIYFKDNHLFADTSEVVDASYRFTTPEIEEALARLRERIKEEGARTGKKIPEILMGTGDGNIEGIMVEKIERATPEPTIGGNLFGNQ